MGCSLYLRCFSCGLRVPGSFSAYGRYASVIASHSPLGTCSEVAGKASCALAWAGSGLIVNKAPFRVATQPHRPSPRVWRAPCFLLSELGRNTLPSSSPSYSHPSGVHWGHFLRGVFLAVHPIPACIKSHRRMVSKPHGSFLCRAPHTWTFPFYLCDYCTDFCLTPRS